MCRRHTCDGLGSHTGQFNPQGHTPIYYIYCSKAFTTCHRQSQDTPAGLLCDACHNQWTHNAAAASLLPSAHKIAEADVDQQQERGFSGRHRNDRQAQAQPWNVRVRGVREPAFTGNSASVNLVTDPLEGVGSHDQHRTSSGVHYAAEPRAPRHHEYAARDFVRNSIPQKSQQRPPLVGSATFAPPASPRSTKLQSDFFSMPPPTVPRSSLGTTNGLPSVNEEENDLAGPKPADLTRSQGVSHGKGPNRNLHISDTENIREPTDTMPARSTGQHALPLFSRRPYQANEAEASSHNITPHWRQRESRDNSIAAFRTRLDRFSADERTAASALLLLYNRPCPSGSFRQESNQEQDESGANDNQ